MAKLTSGERTAMPTSDFALPAKRQGGKGGFPIPDKAHAKAALGAADGARTGKPLPPAQKAEVREKVAAKFPSMGKSGGSKGTVPRGEHHQASHREPRSADEFHSLGSPKGKW